MNPVRHYFGDVNVVRDSIKSNINKMSNGVNPLPAYLQRTGVLSPKSEPKILEAFGVIDRADFLPDELKSSAYSDEAFPIGHGQTISQPYTVAFMLKLLQPKAGEKIMDVGAGSGWQTALLAQIVGSQGKVLAVERVAELCGFGRANVSKYNFVEGIVEWFCQDASAGLPDNAPFDKIIAAASIVDYKVPKAWEEQLKVGGRMVVPIENSVWLFIKQKDGTFQEKEFPGFVFVPFIKDGADR